MGISGFFLVRALMKLSYPLKRSADLDISSNEPPLNDDSMIGSRAD